MRLYFYDQHTTHAGLQADADECNSDDIFLWGEGDPEDLLRQAVECLARPGGPERAFERKCSRAVVQLLQHLLIPADIYRGWLYYANHERNVYVSSGGTDTGASVDGSPVYVASGVTIDEGDGAVLPADADDIEIGSAWVLP